MAIVPGFDILTMLNTNTSSWHMKLLKGAHLEYRGRNLCLGNARKYVFGDTDSQLKVERIRVPKHIFVCVPKK